MISLNKENVTEYVNRHVPSLTFHEPVEVIQIGDGDLGKPRECPAARRPLPPERPP